jgi:hypothetical protein
MTPDTSPVVTLVVRARVAAAAAPWRELRYETTHVQTGEVSYFGSLEAVAQYVKRLADRLPPRMPGEPIEFARWRRH